MLPLTNFDPRAPLGAVNGLPAEVFLSPVSAAASDVITPADSPAAGDALLPMDLLGRVVLLATDGSPASVAATRVADALARERGAIVHAISVLDTRPAPIPPPLDLALAIADAATGPAVHARQVEFVRNTLTTTIGKSVEWPVHVMIGTPATAIAQEAKRLHAALVVIGLRRHGAFDRAVHDETTLSVIRRSHCPVFGVVAAQEGLPHRVLAAVDFGRSSIAAARRAAGLLGSGASLLLAYVPPLVSDGMEEGESFIRELGVAAAFARCERELSRPGLHIDRVVLHHKLPTSVAKLVLEYASASRADLVAAGSMRHGRLDRWLLGSVSTELVRDGRRSVLIVPPMGEEAQRDLGC
jgi:nucleotide-binding universal stress UspA family protein